MDFQQTLNDLRTGRFVSPDTPVGAVFYGIIFFLLAWVAGRALRLAVQRVLARDTHAYVDRTTINFLAQLAKMGVWLFAFISYAHLVPALAHLGSAWLTGVSVISVVMGLAAQSTLGNLIAGISLILYRPFKLGDRMQVSAPTGLETGVVESLGLGYTVLRTDDNRRIVLPNSVMSSQTTVNLTNENPRALSSVPFTISYDSDVERARSILLELARKSSRQKEVSGCPVTQVGPTGIVLTLTAWCPDPGAAGDFKSEMLELAPKRFVSSGVLLALPQTVVTLKGQSADGQGSPLTQQPAGTRRAGESASTSA